MATSNQSQRGPYNAYLTTYDGFVIITGNALLQMIFNHLCVPALIITPCMALEGCLLSMLLLTTKARFHT